MSWLLSILVLILLTLSSTSSLTADLFEKWCKQHGKTYASDQEKLQRLRVFEDNHAYVTHHNNLTDSSYTLSLNAFADLTHNEFKASRLGLSASANNLTKITRESAVQESSSVNDVPSSLDWRKSGAVTPVKDQGNCAADTGLSKLVVYGAKESYLYFVTVINWKRTSTNVKTILQCTALRTTSAIVLILHDCAIAATTNIGGFRITIAVVVLHRCMLVILRINKIVTGSLISLSEQELVDCDRSYDSGCGGGLMDYAFQFVDTEEDYPYQGGEKSCNRNKLKRCVVTIDGYVDVPESDEKQLLQAVVTQPVSVGICGSERAFQLYSKGIFTGPCSTSLDHAVLIVGYDSKDGLDYWILKNSWGTSWGMNGYMYMQRNSGNSQGICGINMLASYPTKSSPNPPPPPSPGPTKCDILTSCSGGETCCCARRFLGICFSWKCCELNSAVCCKDHRHCCPHDYPICDTERNLCLKRTGNGTIVKELGKKGSFGKFGGWTPLLEHWIM
ncbi:hypothetical protein RJ639_013066 [Escallonia herrerae]|uniref:Uncharacterized protein n=1 Tax=Escallonia herrerae TaxID=1293975 RepID=A0AA88VLT0_9ASTE|nr:hypothetical protein RJ639_013066 [Escallonia herrerae]